MKSRVRVITLETVVASANVTAFAAILSVAVVVGACRHAHIVTSHQLFGSNDYLYITSVTQTIFK